MTRQAALRSEGGAWASGPEWGGQGQGRWCPSPGPASSGRHPWACFQLRVPAALAPVPGADLRGKERGGPGFGGLHAEAPAVAKTAPGRALLPQEVLPDLDNQTRQPPLPAQRYRRAGARGGYESQKSELCGNSADLPLLG